jgi:hypothetical protein
MATVTTEVERLPDIEELSLQSSPSTAVQRQIPDAAVVNMRHAACAAAASGVAEDDAADANPDRQPQVPGTQRLWIRTFGCSHNISDSEYMAGMLQQVRQMVSDISVCIRPPGQLISTLSQQQCWFRAEQSVERTCKC